MKITIVFTAFLGMFVTSGYTEANCKENRRWILDQQYHKRTPISVNDEGHNCRMWAAISNNIEDGVICNHLIEFTNSLKNLSRIINIDGWGIAYYPDFGDVMVMERGAVRAFNDPDYDSVVVQINASKPKITLAHVRNCGSGCCCHGCETIANPHPFWRYKNAKSWIFAHNGHVSKSLLYSLIGEEYLKENPPNGSGIPECDPIDTSLIVDSELLFLYLLKNIEENDWNTIDGIVSAITELARNDASPVLNFILSDGYNIWAFRKGAFLFYLYDSIGDYCAVATMYPSDSQDDWQQINDYELVSLSADEAPILNLPSYIPGDTNGDGSVVGSDITYGVRYLKGLGPVPPDSCQLPDSSWLYSAADANGSCVLNGADITYLISYFKGIQQAILWCPQTPLFGGPATLRKDEDVISVTLPEE